MCWLINIKKPKIFSCCQGNIGTWGWKSDFSVVKTQISGWRAAELTGNFSLPPWRCLHLLTGGHPLPHFRTRLWRWHSLWMKQLQKCRIPFMNVIEWKGKSASLAKWTEGHFHKGHWKYLLWDPVKGLALFLEPQVFGILCWRHSRTTGPVQHADSLMHRRSRLQSQLWWEHQPQALFCAHKETKVKIDSKLTLTKP